MNYDEWNSKYKPVEFIDTVTGHPYLLETFGEELEKVLAAPPENVWTLIDGDDGNTYIVNGYHHVNRINYIITEEPFEGDFLEILDD